MELAGYALGGAVASVVGARAAGAWTGLSLRMVVVSSIYAALGTLPVDPPRSEAELREVVERHRRAWDRVALLQTRVLGFMMPSVGSVLDTSVRARDGHAIRIRVVAPPPPSSSPNQPPKGVIVYAHGGGFTWGTLEAYELVTRKLAVESGAVVVAVDYRLAPEHKFPQGLMDVQDVVEWVATTPIPAALARVGADPSKAGIAMVGDSAGGNLATVSTVELKRLVPFRAQVLMYPHVSTLAPVVRDISTSIAHNYRAPIVTPATLATIHDLYLPNPPLDSLDPRASPLLYPEASLRGCPPTLIATASHDPLTSDAVAFADRLRRANVPVQLNQFQGTIHGFASMDMADGFSELHTLMGSFLRRALGVRSSSSLSSSSSPSRL